MKRFVDIRGQGAAYRFCWFDTVVDQIERHGENTVWDTFAEFEQDCEGNLERYRGLTPEWAFSENPNEPLWSAEIENA